MQIEGKKADKNKTKEERREGTQSSIRRHLTGNPRGVSTEDSEHPPPPKKKESLGCSASFSLETFRRAPEQSFSRIFANAMENPEHPGRNPWHPTRSLLRIALCSALERSRASSWESLEFNGESRASCKESLASHQKSFENHPLLGMGKISSILLRILEIQRRIPSILKGIPSIPSECSSMATTVRVLGRNSVESRASSWASLLPCRCCWFAWRCCRCFWFFFRAPSFFINAMEFADRPRSLVVWFFFFE